MLQSEDKERDADTGMRGIIGNLYIGNFIITFTEII